MKNDNIVLLTEEAYLDIQNKYEELLNEIYENRYNYLETMGSLKKDKAAQIKILKKINLKLKQISKEINDCNRKRMSLTKQFFSQKKDVNGIIAFRKKINSGKLQKYNLVNRKTEIMIQETISSKLSCLLKQLREKKLNLDKLKQEVEGLLSSLRKVKNEKREQTAKIRNINSNLKNTKKDIRLNKKDEKNILKARKVVDEKFTYNCSEAQPIEESRLMPKIKTPKKRS